MDVQKNIKVMVVEKDRKIVNSIVQVLKSRSYELNIHPGWGEAERNLKERYYELVLIGETEEGESPFHVMKHIVRVSPMASIILITDISDEEVQEKAEGYGILGSIDRAVPQRKLTQLLNNFESIYKSTSSVTI